MDSNKLETIAVLGLTALTISAALLLLTLCIGIWTGTIPVSIR